MPITATGDVFDALMAAGKIHGIAPVGYRALNRFGLRRLPGLSSDITQMIHRFMQGWTGQR
jgi:4-methylaminobutanoate oxidase (formaldehyde-forming)